MGPVPEENHNPADKDLPSHSESDELESPNHVVPPADNSSDEDDEFDSDMEGPANDGYMLLPQDPEEEGGGDGVEAFQPQPIPPLSAVDGEVLSTEPMTEVRGVGVDLSEAVAQGNVHPAFAASFPDNKVPVHLQVPDPLKVKKGDVLWNQTAPDMDRLQLDSAQLSKVKSAMAGFQLPKANIPDWAQHIPEDDWKQQLVTRLASPMAVATSSRATAGYQIKLKTDASATGSSEGSGKEVSEWPGTSGT